MDGTATAIEFRTALTNGAPSAEALVIDPEQLHRRVIEECLRFVGVRAFPVFSLDAAISELDRWQRDVLIWRVADPVESLSQRLLELRTQTQAPLIVIDRDPERAKTALAIAADQWLPDPFAPEILVGAVMAVLRRFHQRTLPILGECAPTR